MGKTSESKFQKDCINLCRKYGCYVYKNAQSMFTEKGRPDLTACIPVKIKDLLQIFSEDTVIGLFAGFEIKTDKNYYDTTDAQDIVGRKIANCGGIFMSIENLSELERCLKFLTGGNNDL